MTNAANHDAPSTIDAAEIALFSKVAGEWWDPRGPMKPLHWVTPFRMSYLKNEIAAHLGLNPDDPQPLRGLRILDVGCGGGLVAEPLTRLGAMVTGIDPSEANIKVAGLHAAEGGLEIEYLAVAAEDLAAQGRQFDVVLAIEVVDHVNNVELFVGACCQMVRPGGLSIMSTINRTAGAFLLMIVFVEYLLRWIPRGTHHFEKFVTPQELSDAFGKAGMRKKSSVGMRYNPFNHRHRFTRSHEVSYYMVAEKWSI
jgi:2-polyprenyl-6-hydroxyphenyl methylase/3-demethylubiquinone-9 3-methyltransferase